MRSTPISLTLDLNSDVGRSLLLTAINNIIAGNFNSLQLEINTKAPAPKEGLIAYADGTDWNPGSGEGLYGYTNGAWVFLNNVATSFTEIPVIDLQSRTAAPSSPTEGMIAFANGTNWNPGSGKGFYGYTNGAWVFLNNVEPTFTEIPVIDLQTRTSAPSSPTEGMIAFANGTNWNPGSGKGFYGYTNGAWVFLNNVPPPSLNNLDTIDFTARWSAPTPTDGLIAFADGNYWNPGSGAGFYGYHNGIWNFLG